MELAKYSEALSRWEDYERESAPLWADPRPTPGTLDFFAGYFYNEDLLQGRLQQYAEADVQISGLPRVVWSRALAVNGSSVTIRQCIDPSEVRVTQRGQLIPNSATPILREIELSAPDSSPDFLISRIQDPSWGRKEQACA